MKKAYFPSAGFLLLFFVGSGSVALIFWALLPPWYGSSKRISQSQDRYAAYLEKIARKTDFTPHKSEWFEEALSIRINLGDRERAESDFENLASLLSPEELKPLQFKMDRFLGKPAEAAKQARELFSHGMRGDDVLLALAEEVVKDRSDPLYDPLIEAVLHSNSSSLFSVMSSEIFTFGMTGDRWTNGIRPGFLIIANLNANPVRYGVRLGAPENVRPLHVKIQDGGLEWQLNLNKKIGESITHYFEPLKGGESKLVEIRSDKAWIPRGGKDPRTLGIRLKSFLKEKP